MMTRLKIKHEVSRVVRLTQRRWNVTKVRDASLADPHLPRMGEIFCDTFSLLGIKRRFGWLN
jgi:hypothetical protein